MGDNFTIIINGKDVTGLCDFAKLEINMDDASYKISIETSDKIIYCPNMKSNNPHC